MECWTLVYPSMWDTETLGSEVQPWIQETLFKKTNNSSQKSHRIWRQTCDVLCFQTLSAHTHPCFSLLPLRASLCPLCGAPAELSKSVSSLLRSL